MRNNCRVIHELFLFGCVTFVKIHLYPFASLPLFPGSSARNALQKRVPKAPKAPRVSALDKWIKVRNMKKVAPVVVVDEQMKAGDAKVEEVTVVELEVVLDGCEPEKLPEGSWERGDCQTGRSAVVGL